MIGAVWAVDCLRLGLEDRGRWAARQPTDERATGAAKNVSGYGSSR